MASTKELVERLLADNKKLAEDLLLIIPAKDNNDGGFAYYAGLVIRITHTRYYKYDWKSVWVLTEERNFLMSVYEGLFLHKTTSELNAIYRKFSDFSIKFCGCGNEYGDIILTNADANHMSFRCHRLLPQY